MPPDMLGRLTQDNKTSRNVFLRIYPEGTVVKSCSLSVTTYPVIRSRFVVEQFRWLLLACYRVLGNTVIL